MLSQTVTANQLSNCDQGIFPNLIRLLKIGCTLPVASYECERSFSALRRLKTWLRSSATTKRLPVLNIMIIIYCKEVDYEKAFCKFLALHTRKYNCSNLVFDMNE